jgi:hypothetical protein
MIRRDRAVFSTIAATIVRGQSCAFQSTLDLAVTIVATSPVMNRDPPKMWCVSRRAAFATRANVW